MWAFKKKEQIWKQYFSMYMQNMKSVLVCDLKDIQGLSENKIRCGLNENCLLEELSYVEYAL